MASETKTNVLAEMSSSGDGQKLRELVRQSVDLHDRTRVFRGFFFVFWGLINFGRLRIERVFFFNIYEGNFRSAVSN